MNVVRVHQGCQHVEITLMQLKSVQSSTLNISFATIHTISTPRFKDEIDNGAYRIQVANWRCSLQLSKITSFSLSGILFCLLGALEEPLSSLSVLPRAYYSKDNGCFYIEYPTIVKIISFSHWSGYRFHTQLTLFFGS